jgi:hypothetical protein
MTKCTSFFIATLLSFTVACGDDGSGSPGMPDAAAGENALGVPCGESQPDCPAGHTCAILGLPDGSDTMGYCTPACTEDADCMEGFTGPGSASCFRDMECVVSCETEGGTDGVCPAGLTCLSTGGPTFACGVAAE